MIRKTGHNSRFAKARVSCFYESDVPDKLRERVFEKLFETAEIAKFTPDQVRSYEDSLKYYRDLKNSLDTAKEEKVVEIAKRALKMGLSVDDITEFTGLSR